MGIVVILHPLLRRVYNAIYVSIKPAVGASQQQQGDYRSCMRISYDLLFAAIFLFVLHGFSAFKVLAILSINYQIATGLPRSVVPVATWTFNMFILFANELCHGYQYSRVAEMVLPAPFAQGETSWGAWLDSYGGLIPRWEILFNITVLRLISFNLDYYWSLDHANGSAVEVSYLLDHISDKVLTVIRRSN